MSAGEGWGFTRGPGGYAVHLADAERRVLADVVDQVVELLGGIREEPGAGAHPLQRVQLGGEPIVAPSDAALLRLLPDGSRGDPRVAAEYRRLTEADLRATKTAQLSRFRALLDGSGAPLDPDEAPAVAAAMTDVRLVLAERLGIHDEADAEAAYRLAVEGGRADPTDDGTRLLLATVSAILGVLLESLIDLLTDELP